MLEELVAVARVERERGDAGRGGHDVGHGVAVRAVRPGHRRSPAQAVGHDDAVCRPAGHEDARTPRRRTARRCRRRASLRATSPTDGQEPVACSVSVAVVVGLEAVEVDAGRASCSRRSGARAPARGHRLGEEVVVAKAREAVGERARAKLAAGAGLMLEDSPPSADASERPIRTGRPTGATRMAAPMTSPPILAPASHARQTARPGTRAVPTPARTTRPHSRAAATAVAGRRRGRSVGRSAARTTQPPDGSYAGEPGFPAARRADEGLAAQRRRAAGFAAHDR